MREVTVKLKDVRPGDVVVTGLHAGRWQQGTREVLIVQNAVAHFYKVVKFTDNETTSAHLYTDVVVQRR